REHPQQVQRIGMFGNRGQDLAIDSLGLGQTTGLVMLDGRLHCLLDGYLRHRPCRAVRMGSARCLSEAESATNTQTERITPFEGRGEPSLHDRTESRSPGERSRNIINIKYINIINKYQYI